MARTAKPKGRRAGGEKKPGSSPKKSAKKITGQAVEPPISAADLLERVSDGFAAFDAEMNYTYVNKKGGELLGRKPADLIGKNYWVEFPEAKGTPFANAYMNALKTQKPLVIEDYYAPWERWFENRIYPSKDGLSIFFTEITERKRVEQVVRESQERYSALFEQAHDAVFILDLQGRHLDANRRAADMLGYTREELKTLSVSETSGELVESRQVIQRLLNGEYVPHYERIFRRKSGESLPVEINVELVRDAEGKPLHIQSVVRDITERKRAEEALRENHERLQKVLEVETVGVMFWDLTSGVMTDANDTFLNLMGYSRRDVEAGELTWQKLTPPEYVEVSLAEIRKFQTTGRVGPYEKEYLRKDGTRQWLVFAGSSLGGNTCVEFCVDISARKQAEEALRESEERYRTLTESSHDLITLVNRQMQVEYTNSFAAQQFGSPPQDLIGKHLTALFPAEIAERQMSNLRKVFESGEPLQIEAFVPLQDKMVWLSTALAPIKDKEYEINTILIVSRDITERKQVEEALRRTEKFYHSILEDITEMIIRFQPDGTLTYVNEAYCHYYGRSREELIGSNFIASSSGDFPQKLRAHFDSFTPDRPISRFEQYDTLPDGQIRWREWIDHALFDKEGRLVEFQSTGRDITERKQAEDAVRNSEARYRELFESNPHPMWVYDLETLRFLAVNDAAVLHYGYSRGEFLALTIKDIRPPEDVGRLLENISRVADGSDEAGIWRHIKKNGQVIEVEITSHVLDFDGRRAEMVLAHDVTERRRAEMEIRRRNEDLSLLDSVNQALNRGESLSTIVTLVSEGLKRIFPSYGATIYLLNAEHQRLVNQNMALPPDLQEKIEKLLGFTVPRIELDLQKAHPFRQIFETKKIQVISEERGVLEHYLAFAEAMPLTPILRAAARKAMLAVPKLVGMNSEMLIPLVSAGEVIGVMDFGSRIPFTDEDVSRMESIAAQLTAAIQRKQAEQALRESETRYRSIFDGVQEAIFLESPGGDILDINESACRMFGWTREEFLTKKVSDLVPAGREAFMLDENGQGQLPEKFFETANIRADGEEFPVEISGRRHTLDGNPCLLVVVRDITERKRAGEALRESEEKLQNIIRHSASMFYSHTPEHVLTFVSPQSRDLLGYEPEEAKVRWQGFLSDHPANQAGIEATQRALETGERQPPYELELLTRAGRKIWVQVDESPIVREGEVVAITGSLTDISERKRAEEQLRRRVQELEALYQSGIAFSRTLDPADIGEKIIEVLAGRLDWHHAVVRVRRGESDELETLAFSRSDEKETDEQVRSTVSRLGHGMAGWVVEHGLPLWSADLENDPRYVATYAGMRSGLYVPIKIFDKTIGCINVESDLENAFSEVDERLLSTIALQAAVTLENARMYRSALHSARRRDVLYEAGQWMVRATQDREEVYAAVHRAVSQLMPAEAFTIVLYHAERNELESAYLFDKGGRWDAPVIPLGEGFSSQVIVTGETVLNNDLLKTPLNAVHFGTEEQVRSVLAVPLRSGNKVIGAISTQSYQPDAFTGEDRILLEMLAAQTAIAFENTRLFQNLELELAERKRAERELGQRADEFSALYDTARSLAGETDLQKVLQTILDQSIALLGTMNGTVSLYDEERDELVLAAKRDFPAQIGDRRGMGEGMAGMAAQNRQPVIVDDYNRWEGRVENLAGADLRAAVEVPLIYHDQLIGTLGVGETGTSRKFDEKDARLLSLIGAHAAGSVENARLFQFLQNELNERKQAEKALAESEARYRTLLDQLPAIVYLDDARVSPPATRFVSPRIADFIGIEPGEWLAGGFDLWENVIHPDDRERVAARYMESIERESSFSQEYRMIARDGRMLWVRDSAVIQRGENGRPGDIQGVIYDITESKKAEERIRQQVERLTALQAVDKAIASTFEMDLSLDILLSRALKLLSTDAASILLVNAETATLRYTAGRGFMTGIEKTASVKVGESYAGRVVSDGHAVHIANIASESGNLFPDGFLHDEGFVEYHGVPLLIKGQIQGVMEVFNRVPLERDEGWYNFLEALAGQASIAIDNAQLFAASQRELAERKQAQEDLRVMNLQLENRIEARTADLREANSELERALRVKDEFLANMSHELRTPLNAVIGLSDSLAEEVAGTLNDKQRKYVNTIRESGEHLLDLINDILDLAKIEAGQVALDRDAVDVNAVCQSSLRMIKQIAHKKNQVVRFEMDGIVGELQADERRLKQMIVNLLGNAVKFTGEGGELGLRVTGDVQNRAMRFTVWDTGIGIHEDDLPKLFKPFVQLDSSLARKSSGTGLGLALVAKMADLHGGSVGVESQPGEGSRFTITLPWEPDSVESVPGADKEPEAPPSTPDVSRANHTILLVDDTDDVVALFKDYLEYAGYKVALARNGAEGVKVAQEIRPSLILMDVQMPVMDGLEATRRIRAIPALERTPVIALTALAMKGDRERCLEAGMNEYLSKPVMLRTLLETIEKHLSTNQEETQT